jgi:hypothetical protein
VNGYLVGTYRQDDTPVANAKSESLRALKGCNIVRQRLRIVRQLSQLASYPRRNIRWQSLERFQGFWVVDNAAH